MRNRRCKAARGGLAKKIALGPPKLRRPALCAAQRQSAPGLRSFSNRLAEPLNAAMLRQRSQRAGQGCRHSPYALARSSRGFCKARPVDPGQRCPRALVCRKAARRGPSGQKPQCHVREPVRLQAREQQCHRARARDLCKAKPFRSTPKKGLPRADPARATLRRGLPAPLWPCGPPDPDPG